MYTKIGNMYEKINRKIEKMGAREGAFILGVLRIFHFLRIYFWIDEGCILKTTSGVADHHNSIFRSIM